MIHPNLVCILFVMVESRSPAERMTVLSWSDFDLDPMRTLPRFLSWRCPMQRR